MRPKISALALLTMLLVILGPEPARAWQQTDNPAAAEEHCDDARAVVDNIAAHAGEGDKVIRSTEATLINHADFMSFHSIQRMGQDKKLAAKVG